MANGDHGRNGRHAAAPAEMRPGPGREFATIQPEPMAAKTARAQDVKSSLATFQAASLVRHSAKFLSKISHLVYVFFI